MNRVFLMGRLTASPELKTTQSGISCCRCSIAVDRRPDKDGNKKTDFIDLVLWRQTAEFFTKYFSKGQLVAVEGALNVDNYEKDGQKRKAVYVTVAEVHFTGDRRQADAAPSNTPSSYSNGSADSFEPPIDDTDLPF